MSITPTASSWNWMATHLRQRDVTLAGLSYASLKLSMEQLAGQAAGQIGHGVGSALDLGRFDRLHLLDSVLGGLAVMLGFGDGWASGPVGIAVTLILPLGGPIWGGLIPVETTLEVPTQRLAAGEPSPHTFPGARRRGCSQSLREAGGENSASWRRRSSRYLQCAAAFVQGGCVSGAHERSHHRRQPSVPGGLRDMSLLATDSRSSVRPRPWHEAVALAEEVRPQVALVDIHLAGESGFEVARRLSASCSDL